MVFNITDVMHTEPQPNPGYRVLSIHACRDREGWTRNQRYTTGVFAPEECLTWTNRGLLKWLRETGLLHEDSKGKVAVQDDQYNLVILARGNRMPLFAIEYGSSL